MIVGGAASASRYLFECIIDYSYSDHTLSLAIKANNISTYYRWKTLPLGMDNITPVFHFQYSTFWHRTPLNGDWLDDEPFEHHLLLYLLTHQVKIYPQYYLPKCKNSITANNYFRYISHTSIKFPRWTISYSRVYFRCTIHGILLSP